MATTATAIDRPKVSVSYDDLGDVLHIVKGKPVPYEGDGRSEGIELDFGMNDDTPCGAKVIGFRKNGWPDRLDELAGIIGNHLTVDTKVLKSVILRQTV